MTCSNCGYEAAVAARYCAGCGAQMSGAAGRIVITAFKVLAALALGLLGVGFGAAGACFGIVGLNGKSPALMAAVILLGLCGLCIAGIVALMKTRRSEQ